MTYARWPGVSPAHGRFVSGPSAHAGAGASSSTTATTSTAKVPASDDCVTSAAGALSSSIQRSRSAGYAGSSGT